MIPRICASILPKTVYEAQALIRKAEESHVDFIEIRLDLIKTDAQLNELGEGKKVPLIAADKSRKNEAERQAMLLKAAKSGFQFVDVDLSSPKLQNFISQAKMLGAKSVVSFHDLTKTPGIPELNRILEREISSGADVCKIVTTAHRIEDNLTLLQFIQTSQVRKKPVCFAMGELGKISRLLSPVFGSFYTYASLEHGNETAPGQMTVKEMTAAYEILGFK